MKRNLLTAVILLSLPILACAQSRGSYFFENSLMRSKLNAAFAPKSTYISVPVLGSASVDAASNVGLGNFIFQKRRDMYTFLNEDIDATMFFRQLPDSDPYLAERIETDLLGGGMPWGEHGYATVSLSVVENGSVSIPLELLRFAKLGRNADTHSWDIPGPDVALNGYLSLAAGYSHDFSPLVEGLRAGARVKLLVGLAAAGLQVDRLSADIEEDAFRIGATGSGHLSGILYQPDNGFHWGGFGLRGLGGAIDLGVEYRLPLDGFFSGVNVSASVNDLGFLWFNRSLTGLSANKSFSFSGFQDFGGDDMQAQIDRVIGDFQDLTHFDTTGGDPFVQTLTPSIYAGAETTFLDEIMHVGLLYYRTVGHHNLMASYGVSPFEWLNLGVNWTFLGPASRFGFFAEYIPKKYVGLFFGMERASFKRNSSHLAIGNFTDSFSFGLNVLFGDWTFIR